MKINYKEKMMIKVTIIRNKGWFGRLRTAKIMADGVEIGLIESGETVTIKVPDHANNLYAKMDWARSKPYPLNNIKDGQTIYMNAWFTMNPFRTLGLMTMPMALQDKAK